MTKNFPAKEGFSKTLSNINLGVFVNQNGEITDQVTLDEINKLIELQLLKPKRKGKALHYN
jgi:hypothetical protein